MQKLTIHNPKYLNYTDDLFSIDVLGGVDCLSLERMACTLRFAQGDYPMYRRFIDLYSESQVDKLLRTLCDKYELRLLQVSKSLQGLTLELEKYRIDNIDYKNQKIQSSFEVNKEDEKAALKTLKSKRLMELLLDKFHTIGILGEDINVQILVFALASHKYSQAFSVLCRAKSGIGKSYIIQNLSDCMPEGSYSYHTQMSPNALYYFDSRDLHHKALIIEDLEWSRDMLRPLSSLQSGGKLVKTRATKDQDGLYHASSYEVSGKLCLVACTDSSRKDESLSLPFLSIELNHSKTQDEAVMEYQKKCKAGLISSEQILQAKHQIKCLIASLENLKIINPYAPLIELPKDISQPRKSLLLLLNFIELITFFYQHQRKKHPDPITAEVTIHTEAQDIALAFSLLRNSLFRRVDELSAATRKFYDWLSKYLSEAQTSQFKAIDIRKARSIHPRTLNRYLNELRYYSYITISGGNKHREGYEFKITDLNKQRDKEDRIEKVLHEILDKIRMADEKAKNSRTVRQKRLSDIESIEVQTVNSKTT